MIEQNTNEVWGALRDAREAVEWAERKLLFSEGAFAREIRRLKALNGEHQTINGSLREENAALVAENDRLKARVAQLETPYSPPPGRDDGLPDLSRPVPHDPYPAWQPPQRPQPWQLPPKILCESGDKEHSTTEFKGPDPGAGPSGQAEYFRDV
ncbi:MAG: hypothetical protein OJJ55_06565 [Rhodococcus sp.]|nr:hypothetical protein [Rhodococcus sp. (in: high G+C Gram-positive bacteria)]